MSFQTQVANTPTQWITAGSYGPPAVLPCYYPSYQYPNFDEMGRKKGAVFPLSYPTEGAASLPRHPVDAPSKARRDPPWRNSSQQPSVSQRSIYSIVDAWRTYKSDNANDKNNQNTGANAQHQFQSQQQVRQSQWAAEGLWNTTRPLPSPPQFRPQAAVFQPGQSRYDLRPRHISTMAADQILQSIETDDAAQQLPAHFSGQRRHHPRSTPRRGPTPINTEIEPPAPPKVSQKYLEVAQQAPCRLLQPQKLLILLDLNGTLVYRSGVHRKNITKRPGVDRLIAYLFANHYVMLFTSATMQSAKRMAKELFTAQQYGQLIAIRSREHLNLTPEQFRNKVQVYKDLSTIWEDPGIRKAGTEAGVRWDMTNTILIDDSIIKAKSHPHNLLQVSEFQEPEQNMATVKKTVRAKWEKQQVDVMRSVEQKLEDLKWQVNVACLVREWQDGELSALEPTEVNVDQQHVEIVNKNPHKEPEAFRNSYPTPISLDGARAVGEENDHDGDEEYDPDQWQGVKLPTPTSHDHGPVVIDHKDVESKRGPEAKHGSRRATRSPLPVTTEHFQWLSLKDKDCQ